MTQETTTRSLVDSQATNNIPTDSLVRAYAILIEIAKRHELESLTTRDIMDGKQKDDPTSGRNTDRV